MWVTDINVVEMKRGEIVTFDIEIPPPDGWEPNKKPEENALGKFYRKAGQPLLTIIAILSLAVVFYLFSAGSWLGMLCGCILVAILLAPTTKRK